MTQCIDFFQYCDLIVKLNEWTKSYEDSNPIVSDSVYDNEYKKLKQFELENPNYIEPDSPTQNVGYGTTGDKVDHIIPMLSIANSMSSDDLRQWCIDKHDKKCIQKTIEYKIDGMALSLIYKDGLLVDAITRGNGVCGDRVYSNAIQIKDIPKTIPSLLNRVEIRGECVWLKTDFDAYNIKLESMGKEPMSNARNGASGTMKSKNPKDVAERKLSFVAYSIVDGSTSSTQSEDLTWLQHAGFITSDFFVCDDIDTIINTSIEMEKGRHSQPFLIDGLVIKVNDKNQYKRLGGTSKSPHFCTALKFPPEEKQTKLISIEHSYGRSGAVTPVAILETIELALTKVSRASLHNWDLAEYLGCHIGCNVVVRKAGEIIPEIVKVVETERRKDDYEKAIAVKRYDKVGPFNIHYDNSNFRNEYELAHGKTEWYIRPYVCEHCGTSLQHSTNRDGEYLVAWVCPNSKCTVKQFKQIVKFVANDVMNIMGVGESLIESLLSKGLIKNVSDLYKLSKDDLLTLYSVKERSADKIIDAINESRKAYMNNLLHGLGIPYLGKTSSSAIADSMLTLETVSHANVTQFESIDGIGEELAKSIVEWFANQSNMEIVQYFIDNNIACNIKPSNKTTGKLNGKIFIMTGKCENLGRGEFKDLVLEHGGILASGITSKVDFVVLGEQPGPSKITKINKLKSDGFDIKLISDEDFINMTK